MNNNTFIPRGNMTRKGRIKSSVPKQNNFAACAMSLVNDINLNLIYRSLANFSGKEFFIVGSDKWHKGATNGLEDIVKIKYFKTVNDFLSYMKTTDYDLVAIEQSNNSESLIGFKHPENPCFIFGNETFGLGDDTLLNVDKIVEIPMNGYHPCGNVGVTSGIVFYDYVAKQNYR